MFLAYINKNYLIIAFDSMIDKGVVFLFNKKTMVFQMEVEHNDFIKISLKQIASNNIDKIVFQKGSNQYVRRLIVSNLHNQ